LRGVRVLFVLPLFYLMLRGHMAVGSRSGCVRAALLRVADGSFYGSSGAANVR